MNIEKPNYAHVIFMSELNNIKLLQDVFSYTYYHNYLYKLVLYTIMLIGFYLKTYIITFYPNVLRASSKNTIIITSHKTLPFV